MPALPTQPLLRALGALAAGAVFGLGLAVAQMIDPRKVLGFLDVAGAWDASLLFVMGGAVVLAAAGFRAVLRRRSGNGAAPSNQLRFGSLAIDRDARSVTVNGQACELTSYQFDLLVTLAERAGRVLTRDQIMEAVRGREMEAFDRSIDVHMGRIRAVIEADPKNPKRILTVRGVGYVFARQQD